ncbi:hypothetical protein BD779DRAFT_1671354 [Infundibulicybe gibba]|nr:hypothetical protein BD779DRAFT_1671354 [Infundibulicybe gibba]
MSFFMLRSSVGPPIGGALARSGSWRWLFFLNIPLCAVAFILVLLFLNIRTPRKGLGEMLAKIDWVGLFTIISSTVSISIALNWGGIQHAWSSAQVLVPIILGGVGLVVFFLVEFKHADMPTVRATVLQLDNIEQASTSAHLFMGLYPFYLPVYFQAPKLASPVRSGVDLFGLVIVIPPVSIVTGISVQLLNRYRLQNYLGWIFTIVGFGLLTTLGANSSKAKCVSYQVVLAIGLGIVWIGTQFPILAPLPFSNNAHALAFFTFLRCFAQAGQ